MKKLLLYVVLSLISLPLFGQVPRSALTGIVIDGSHANQSLGVLVTPNPQVWLSDELVPDKELKWKVWAPVTVWRQRKVLGEYRLCPVAIFKIAIDKTGNADDLKPVMFIVPANLVREFDHFSFEYRPWYSISTTMSDGGFTLVPADTSPLYPVGELASRFPINCSESPRSAQHVRLFKE